MLITEILARNARSYGKDIALVERDPSAGTRREISWADFDRESNRFANALLQAGVSKGDRVGQLLMNCLEWLPVYFGILRTGAWAVPLNFRFEAETILACAALSEFKVFLFGPEFVERIAIVRSKLGSAETRYVFLGARESCPDFATLYEDFIATVADSAPLVPLDICDDAALYFTSGTTGHPKAVRLTHRNLEHACYIESQHHSQTRTDTFLCIPPLYHTGAKMHWFGSFIVGGRAVILKGVRPEWILQAVSEERVTIVWLLVPWAHDILISWENGEIDLDSYHLEQWRLMHIGAQPVPPSLIHAWKRVFPKHAYDTNYGLTESTGPGCVHLGIDNTWKIGAIGVPGFDWECRIADTLGRELGDGETGELQVRGPGVMKEYYKDPEETAAVLIDGWLRTGDVARRDKDGFYWLVDRTKDLIVAGGENVSPVEIEHFFMNHPAIQDIAVIGTPDKRLGELITAIVQVKPGMALSAGEFLVFAEPLPRYKRPKLVYFDQVPRNATGKIEKPKLRQKYGQTRS